MVPSLKYVIKKFLIRFCILFTLLPISISARDKVADIIPEKIYCGELATLSDKEFVDRYVPQRIPGPVVYAADFLKGRSHSEAIEAAMASVGKPGTPLTVVLDKQNWIIDRAILLSSNSELVIDGCTLKLADKVFDNIIP